MVSPVLCFLIVFAETLFAVLLPERWLPAVLYLQLLCVSGLFYPLHTINLNILKVRGRSDLVFYLGLVKKFFFILFLVVSYRFGIVGILIGQIASSVFAYFPNSYYSKRLIQYSIKEQFADFFPSTILSASVALAVYGIDFYIDGLGFGLWLRLLVLGPFGVTVYLLIAYFFRMKAFLFLKELLEIKIKKQRGMHENS
jgi:O-antigen/teichoic acid export membrane protein